LELRGSTSKREREGKEKGAGKIKREGEVKSGRNEEIFHPPWLKPETAA